MALINLDTGERTYEGRVYSVRGSFKSDMAHDVVELIEDNGRIQVAEFTDLSRIRAEKDATEENVQLMIQYKEWRSRVFKIHMLRKWIKDASQTMLTTRQYIDLCAGLAENPNWKEKTKYRGLGAELFFANLPTAKFDNEVQVLGLLQRFMDDDHPHKMSKFERSLMQQCVDWATTEPGQRKYDKPLSPKQLQYLDKSWGYAA